MAEDKNHIDDYFRKRLSNAELPISPDDWAAVQNRLPVASKKRRALWWIALLPILAGLIWLAGNEINRYNKIERNLQPFKLQRQDLPKAEQENTRENTVAETPKAPKVLDKIEKSTPRAGLQKNLKTIGQKSGNPKSKENDALNDAQPESDGALQNIQENETTLIEENKAQPEIEMPKSDAIQSSSPANLPANVINSKKNGWFVYAAFGPGFAAWQAEGNNAAPQFTELQSSFNPGTRPFLRVGLGKNIGKWAISSDVDLASLSYSASYNFNKQIFDSIPVLDPNGYIIGYFFNNFRDTAVAYTAAGNVATASLNFMIERKFNIGKKSALLLNLNGGYAFNIGANGAIMNPKSLYKEPLSKEMLNIGNVQAGAGVRYCREIFSNTEIFGGLMLRQRFGNFYKEIQGFNITQYQLEFGLKRNLR